MATSVAKKKPVKKTTIKKATAKKTAKREPTPTTLLKKVSAVSDSTKTLQKEVRIMSKIFSGNQKVLVSMKDMIDTLTSTLESIQKQSKQINILEDDTQKLYAGLNQVRAHSDLITKINTQTIKLQAEVSKISQQQKSSPKTEDLYRQVEDSMNAMKNNSKMIIKIAQRIDDVRDDLRKVSGKTDSLLEVKDEIDQLKDDVDKIYEKTDKLEENTPIINNLKADLEKLGEKTVSASHVNSDLDAIKTTINAISNKASKIDSLGGVLDGLVEQFETVSSKANTANAGIESLREITGKIDALETKITALSQRADSTAFVGEGLKSVQEDLSGFKQTVFSKTDSIENKISSVSDILKRQDESALEFHKKSEKMFSEIQSVRDATRKTSSDSSKEMMSLLKLSEYQSKMRMLAESKYGGPKDLEAMASQTVEIVNLFDRISIESGQNIPLPGEVTQWAVGKILECADRWEIRFSDVYSILTNSIGKDMLKESVRVQQIRDIYGIRAVDEIRSDLGMA